MYPTLATSERCDIVIASNQTAAASYIRRVRLTRLPRFIVQYNSKYSVNITRKLTSRFPLGLLQTVRNKYIY